MITMMSKRESRAYTLPAEALYVESTVICRRYEVLHSSRKSLNACLNRLRSKKNSQDFHLASREKADPSPQSDSGQPNRIDKAIRVGRPKSTRQFEAADLNRHRISKQLEHLEPRLKSNAAPKQISAQTHQPVARRPTRTAASIHADRHESPLRFEPADLNGPPESRRPATDLTRQCDSRRST